ncbi:hypothetical protein EI94DRAFT_847383 [Lactarius quietus]|nr:hypothetical protein EI94DRAFT_847383 [Lactarius quietus]
MSWKITSNSAIYEVIYCKGATQAKMQHCVVHTRQIYRPPLNESESQQVVHHACITANGVTFAMPAISPVDKTLGALFIGDVLSSIIYGITLLQVYSYYNNHRSRDRWPLKSFVAFLTLVDSVNVAFAGHSMYRIGITNFGDYSVFLDLPWSISATALSSVILEVSIQHFYAYRIYLLSGRSLYIPAAISASSLTSFGLVTALSTKGLEHVPLQGTPLQSIFISSLSCDVVCDFLITCGMVYTLLRNRTRVRRYNKQRAKHSRNLCYQLRHTQLSLFHFRHHIGIEMHSYTQCLSTS